MNDESYSEKGLTSPFETYACLFIEVTDLYGEAPSAFALVYGDEEVFSLSSVAGTTRTYVGDYCPSGLDSFTPGNPSVSVPSTSPPLTIAPSASDYVDVTLQLNSDTWPVGVRFELVELVPVTYGCNDFASSICNYEENLVFTSEEYEAYGDPDLTFQVPNVCFFIEVTDLYGEAPSAFGLVYDGEEVFSLSSVAGTTRKHVGDYCPAGLDSFTPIDPPPMAQTAAPGSAVILLP